MCETVLRDQIIRPENNNPGENRNKTTENTSKHFQVISNRALLCSFPSSWVVQVVKNLPVQRHKRYEFDSWTKKISWKRKW